MRVKLDENLPRSLVAVLIASGHDGDTVVDEGLAGASDAAIVAAATASSRLLITLDRGIADLRLFPPGAHAGVLVLRRTVKAATSTQRVAVRG